MDETGEIAAFYAARLDEEEARAWAVHDVGQCDALLYAEDMADAARRDPDCNCGRPARTLREIAAKRRIVADCERAMSRQPGFNAGHARYGSPFPAPHANLAFRTLMSLVSAYDKHPEYKPGWKP